MTRTGTWKYFHSVIKALDKKRLLRKPITTTVVTQRTLRAGKVIQDDEYFRFPQAKCKVIDTYTFPALKIINVSVDYYWNDNLKEIVLEFEPLDYEMTVSNFATQGWQEQAVVELHGDGYWVNEGDDEVKLKTKKLFRYWKNRQRDSSKSLSEIYIQNIQPIN